jgi:nitrate/TMAO reductase-like tetraheme cytochrome c subunit
MFDRIGRFFSPGQSSPWWLRIMPYAALAFAALLIFGLAGAGWEYTNSSEFCGTACHTMPPEYVSYLNSPHANVKCVECHIGRETIATQFGRKAQDISHIIRFVGADYETPIYTKKLRPASQVCEKCHNPAKFSPNSLEDVTHFSAEENNKESTTHLSFKTGGGTHREGMGKGIHWHIENQMEYAFSDDANLQQEIPWVRVTYADTGETETYVDVEAEGAADFAAQHPTNVRQVDCITCHNRVSHVFKTPDASIDDAMARGQISPSG